MRNSLLQLCVFLATIGCLITGCKKNNSKHCLVSSLSTNSSVETYTYTDNNLLQNRLTNSQSSNPNIVGNIEFSYTYNQDTQITTLVNTGKVVFKKILSADRTRVLSTFNYDENGNASIAEVYNYNNEGQCIRREGYLSGGLTGISEFYYANEDLVYSKYYSNNTLQATLVFYYNKKIDNKSFKDYEDGFGYFLNTFLVFQPGKPGKHLPTSYTSISPSGPLPAYEIPLSYELDENEYPIEFVEGPFTNQYTYTCY